MRFVNDFPYMPTGMELDQIWFCGGRVGAAVGGHGGLTKLTYYGRQPMGGAEFFHADPVAAWTKLFRPCVMVDGVPYHPDFNKTTIFPFGYRSEGSAAGVVFQHELVLLNDTVVQRVKILKNPHKAKLTLRLVFHGGPAQTGRSFRTWTKFEKMPKAEAFVARAADSVTYPKEDKKAKKALTQRASFGTHDVERADTFIAVGSDQPAAFTTMHGGFKHHIDTKPIKGSGAFFICFTWDKASVTRRVGELRTTLDVECDAMFASAAAPRPAVRLPDKPLQSFLAQLPGVVDALRVADIPGGMRASAGHYWIWGWDSMVFSKGLMLSGKAAFVEQMLEFYQGLADKRLGIPYAFNTELTPLLAMAFTAQTLYAVMLYNHFCATRDLKTLRRHFPFARWIVEQAMAREVRGSGLIDGPSLFPDFPELLGHDGNDLSVFNNSIFYQALLATRDLARVLAEADGDRKLDSFATTLEATADRCRASFDKVFWDKKAGYFFDSASSVDFSPRRCHPSYAILWVTPYATDLVAKNLDSIASFMADHFANPRGIFHFPPEEQEAFLSDGNQCQAFYPVIEPFYRNVMTLAGRRKEIEAWPKVVEWYWLRNTIPEGLTFDAVNASDLTPDCPGGKQPFAGKAWYELFFTAYAGIDLDINGLAVRPTPVTAPVEISDLSVGGRPLSVKITGKGAGGVKATLNGKPLSSPIRIPLDALDKKRNTLAVTRTTR